MDGIICIDKPQGFTSFDVVAKMRGIMKTKKIGHAGTLDPMATGVLPLFVGRATKACDILPDQTKRYTARFKLGLTTDTQDITGTVTSTLPVSVDEADVRESLECFKGELRQIPPMYSAVQVNGRRLYDLARAGVEVERESRPVHIHHLELLEWDIQEHTYTIDVLCSKGTYIRTLCHDLGQSLGCGATLTFLRRTCSSGYGLEQCITLEQAQQLADQGNLMLRILPVETAFAHMPHMELTARQAMHFRNGVRMSLGQFTNVPEEGEAAIFDDAGLFLGIALVDTEQDKLVQKKLFAPLSASKT